MAFAEIRSKHEIEVLQFGKFSGEFEECPEGHRISTLESNTGGQTNWPENMRYRDSGSRQIEFV
jgi:hypothetical protein